MLKHFLLFLLAVSYDSFAVATPIQFGDFGDGDQLEKNQENTTAENVGPILCALEEDNTKGERRCKDPPIFLERKISKAESLILARLVIYICIALTNLAVIAGLVYCTCDF